jgi:hypothetical protein
MGNSKRRKSGSSDWPVISEDRLWRQMSEVISLREMVAQAELSTEHYCEFNKEDREAEPKG